MQTDAYSFGDDEVVLDVEWADDSLTCNLSEDHSHKGNNTWVRIVTENREQAAPADPVALARKILAWIKTAQDGEVLESAESRNRVWKEAIAAERAVFVRYGRQFSRDETVLGLGSDLRISEAAIVLGDASIESVLVRTDGGRVDRVRRLDGDLFVQILEDPAFPAGSRQVVELQSMEDKEKGEEPDAVPAPAVSRDQAAVTRDVVQSWVDAVFQLDDEAKKEAALQEIREAISSDDQGRIHQGLEAFTRLGEVQFDKASYHDLLVPLLQSGDPKDSHPRFRGTGHGGSPGRRF